LIGEGGQNLAALNYLTKGTVEKNSRELRSIFFVDVNNYQMKKIEEIKDLAGCTRNGWDISKRKLRYGRWPHTRGESSTRCCRNIRVLPRKAAARAEGL